MKYSKARMEYKNAEVRLCALKQVRSGEALRRISRRVGDRLIWFF